MIRRFDIGDRVRVDIPDETDPDHDQWHAREGVVVDITVDDAGRETGDERDSTDFLVEFNDGGESMWFRWRDLRPAISGGER